VVYSAVAESGLALQVVSAIVHECCWKVGAVSPEMCHLGLMWHWYRAGIGRALQGVVVE